ncbi:hypothetical protein Tco_0158426 [Tanacetum coccineum]
MHHHQELSYNTKTQTPIISHDVEEDNHDIEVAHMGNDPYFGIPIPEVPSDQSSSPVVIHTIVPPDHQVSEHNSKWTKDHAFPLEKYNLEPKNYKEALTQACWIEAMQEELHEFERLEVWELVPPPDKAFVISLKVDLKDSSFALTAFADADHAGCQDTRHSTSGSIQLLGDRLVSWSSKRQKSAAISSTEAEYIGIVRLLWLKYFDEITTYRLCFGFNKIPMNCDNKALCALCCNNGSNIPRSKHIDISFHFIKDMFENGSITPDTQKAIAE